MWRKTDLYWRDVFVRRNIITFVFFFVSLQDTFEEKSDIERREFGISIIQRFLMSQVGNTFCGMIFHLYLYLYLYFFLSIYIYCIYISKYQQSGK